MEPVEESLLDGADRFFFFLSSGLAKPLYWADQMLHYRLFSVLKSGAFDNATSAVREIANRALILSCAAAGCLIGTQLLLTAAVLGTGSFLFHCLGIALQ